MPRLVTATEPNSIEAVALSPRNAAGAGAMSVMIAIVARIHSSTGMLRKPST